MLVVVGAAVVVVWHTPHVEVVECCVVEVVDEDVVVDPCVVVVTGVFVPQNCTIEMSGLLWWLSSGRPLFENEPVTCAGLIEYSTDALPPCTTIAEIGFVEAHHAPLSDSWERFTTCSLPFGDVKS